MSIASNLEHIQQKILSATKAAGRDSTEVNVVAVSKRQSEATIRQAYDCGLRHFGENYVQEAVSKKQNLSLPKAYWHFIGHLQGNKVKDVVGEFEYIHSVDRRSLLQKIDRVAKDKGIQQKVFLQVNLAGEESKSGIEESLLESLFFEGVQLEGIKTCGLMIMPPFAKEAESSRPFFAKGKQLIQFLNSRLDAKALARFHISDLSMGTSQDFEVAIQEGATWIRIGSILLGEREK